MTTIRPNRRSDEKPGDTIGAGGSNCAAGASAPAGGSQRRSALEVFRLLIVAAAASVTIVSSFAISARAESRWEVLVAFLGATENDPDYQRDIDRNIEELAALPADRYFQLTIYREWEGRRVTWVRKASGPDSESLAGLYSEPSRVQAPTALKGRGRLKTQTVVGGSPTAFADPAAARALFKQAYPSGATTAAGAPASGGGVHRVLLIYSHGLGPRGLKGLRLAPLKAALEEAPRLDLLFLDSCFMGSIEVAYELRKSATYLLLNEDAEFSSGLPYDAFQTFSKGHDDLETPILDLAERYLESYSFFKNGSQHESVYSSAATVTVVETAKLEALARAIGEAVKAHGRLAPADRAAYGKSLAPYRMQDTALVDLARLVLKLKASPTTPAAARPLWARVAEMLEMTGPDHWKLKSQPRVLIDAAVSPSGGQAVGIAFGYDGFTRGMQSDSESVGRFPPELKPQKWLDLAAAGLPVPSGLWPSRQVKSALYVSPFFPGTTEFDYYPISWIDGKPLGPLVRIERDPKTETRMRLAEHIETPVVLTGYTQSVGKASERYTGLSILDPATGNAGLDYVGLEWNQMTGWSDF